MGTPLPEDVASCTEYAGGGYFRRPDASAAKPSPIVHAPDMVATLRAALWKYGSHTDGCNTIMGWGPDCPCDCGLDALLGAESCATQDGGHD